MTWLNHKTEIRTLAYMGLITAIALTHWALGAVNPWLFASSLVLSFAVSAMHHNHSHRPIWRLPVLNFATDVWFTVFQGHPGYVFKTMHIENHHRFHNGARDITRTDLFRSSNDLLGFLLHPIEFTAAAIPSIVSRVTDAFRNNPRDFATIAIHYSILIGIDVLALLADWKLAIFVVLLPQAAAIFWLLSSNYLQHAHSLGDSEFNHSRNFLGAINPLVFNVGYHTAHHLEPDRHWSELPAGHEAIASRIAPILNEPSFIWYLVRAFILSIFIPRFRSRMPEMEFPLGANNEK